MFALVDRDVIRADVLRDAAGFALGDARLADRVEQAGLAVIDVAHDRDDRRARDDVFGARFALVHLQQLFFEAAHLHVGAELARDHRRGFRVERRVDRQHQPLHQQLGEHVLDAEVELVGEVLHRHAFGERDGARDRRRRGRHRRRRRTRVFRDAARRPVGPGRRDAADTTAATASRDAAGTAALDAAACLAAGSAPAARAADAVHQRALAAAALDTAVAGQARRRDAARPAAADAPRARPATPHPRAGRPVGAAGFGGAIGRCTARGGAEVGSGGVGVGRPPFFDAEPQRRRHDAARNRRLLGWRRRCGRRGRDGRAAAAGASAAGAGGAAGCCRRSRVVQPAAAQGLTVPRRL